MITIIVGCVILQLLYWVYIFNRFVALRNAVKESWSGITVQLELRQTVLTRTVAALKALKEYEDDLIKQLTELRTQTDNGMPLASVNQANNEVVQTCKQLFMLVESNPKLNSSTNFQKFARDISQIEDDIQGARVLFNQSVERHNVLARQIPSNLLALSFGYKELDFFESESLPIPRVSK